MAGAEYFVDQPRRGEVRGEETEERQGGMQGLSNDSHHLYVVGTCLVPVSQQ